MTESRIVRPGRETLLSLKVELDGARRDLEVSRGHDGQERRRLVEAQRGVLVALERYVAALRAAGCAPHWQLTQEIDLLRAVVAGDGSALRVGRR